MGKGGAGIFHLEGELLEGVGDREEGWVALEKLPAYLLLKGGV